MREHGCVMLFSLTDKLNQALRFMNEALLCLLTETRLFFRVFMSPDILEMQDLYRDNDSIYLMLNVQPEPVK